MTTVRAHILGLLFVIGSGSCSAQETVTPSGKSELDGQPTSRLTLSGNETAISHFASSLPSVPVPVPAVHLTASVAGFIRVPPVTVSRTLDSRYFLLNGLHLTMALLDVAVTQRLIATGQYREGNPMMPSSLGAQLGVDFALVGYGSFVSYKLKRQRSNLWWITPVIGVSTHSVGVGVGFSNLAKQ